MVRLLTGARFHTMDEWGSVASALALEGSRILAVGDPAALRARFQGRLEEVDLGGKAVLPGFIDAHHHFAYALFFEAGVDCSPRSALSLSEMIEHLRRAGRALAPGAWVVGFGYDEWRVDERRPPTREFLDLACPDHPCLVSQFTGHEACVNSLALQRVGIHRDTPDPYGGHIERDRHGQPTGRLVGTAMRAAEGLARRAVVERNLERFPGFLGKYEERLFRMGITRIHDPVVPPDLLALYRHAEELGALRIPCVVSPLAPGAQLYAPEHWLEGLEMGSGTELLRIGPVKFILDGAESCHLCLSVGQLVTILVETLRRVADTRSWHPLMTLARVKPRLGRRLHLCNGRPYMRREELARLAGQAVDRGFSIMLHAIGSEAVSQAVDTIRAVRRRHPTSVPPRIEHALFLRPAALPQAAELGCMMVTQPDFVLYASKGLIPPIPRGMRFVGNRSMLEAGLSVALSSDYPAGHFDPLHNLRVAIRRHGLGGFIIQPEEAMNVSEVLRAYTREAARACGCLDLAGTLEPGKRADLVVLNQDPLTAPDLEALEVEETIVGGTTVYRRDREPRAEEGIETIIPF